MMSKIVSKKKSYKENYHIDEIREICDFIQANIGILAKRAPELKRLRQNPFDLTEKAIRSYLTDVRDCATKTRAKYPGSSYLHSKLPVKSIQSIINEEKMRFDEGRPIDVEAMRQLYTWLISPKSGRDNYDDMFSAQAVSIDHIRSTMLKNRQNAMGELDPLTQPQVNLDEKEVIRVYKRYLKAFKEDDLIDHTRFVEDDEIRRNKR